MFGSGAGGGALPELILPDGKRHTGASPWIKNVLMPLSGHVVVQIQCKTSRGVGASDPPRVTNETAVKIIWSNDECGIGRNTSKGAFEKRCDCKHIKSNGDKLAAYY